MKKSNIVITALIIAASAAAVIVYCHFNPDNSTLALLSYVSTLLIFAVIFALIYAFHRFKDETMNSDELLKITENLNTEVAVWTDELNYIFMNKKLREELGLPDTAPDHKAALLKAFGINNSDESLLKEVAESNSYEANFKGTDKSTMTVVWSTSLVKKSKKGTLFISTGFNMTELKKMKVNLASANDFFNSSMELAEIGVIMSVDRKNYRASPEMVKMLGLKSASLTASQFRLLIHPNDRLHFDGALKSDSKEVKCIEMRIKSAGGIYRWYSYRYKSIAGTDNTLPLFGGAILDTTQEHDKDMLIERLAYIDETTEIPNSNKLKSAGQELYEQSIVLNNSFWIIVIDIDRFHIINDTCGYNNGNTILRNFAHLLYKYLTPGGFAARISGDNFALILRDYGDDDLPVRTVKSIQEDFAKLDVDKLAAVSMTCSAGYSKLPVDGNTFLEVLEHAEFALKSIGGTAGSICAYEPSMHDTIIGNTELEKALALAIEHNELQLFYQPKINLANNQIMGVEALIRWIKPDGTIISPDVFVPIAERTQLIGKISDFVLNEGCRQNRLWQKMGYPPIVMSINFASSDFYQDDVKEKVFEALAKSGLDPQWLEVELTESLALIDVEYAVLQMKKLRELGVKLAIDDFGTGYSSFSYLRKLPITLLKLDRSFITDIVSDTIAFEIVNAIVRIAKSMHIETIAEGIESEKQQEILKNIGCNYGQGYLYGKPMPPQELEKLFDKYMKKSKSRR